MKIFEASKVIRKSIEQAKKNHEFQWITGKHFSNFL